MKKPENKSNAQIVKEARAYAKAHGLSSKEAKNELAREAIAVANANVQGNEPVVLSFGMGVDSATILIRFLDEGFETYGIDPANFVVLTAQTGNEYPDLERLVNEHIIPRLTAHGVRWVQVGRRASKGADNLVVIEDSRSPSQTFIDGVYKLSDEMLEAGTVPQAGGARLCSVKSKGQALDAWLRQEFGDTPYRHLIGFEANEMGRALKDVHCGDDNRRPQYPLIDWGWDRDRCLAYLKEKTGEDWVKSACYFCPFSGQGTEKDELARRWETFPEMAADAFMMERSALSFNRTQRLFVSKTAREFAQERGVEAAERIFQEKLSEMTWGLYRVRRIWTGKSNASRSIIIEGQGSRQEMEQALRELAAQEGAALETEEGITRAIHSRKPETFPATEHLIVAAPLTMTKGKTTAKGFEEKFAALSKS